MPGATRLHVGTKDLRGKLEAYAKRFDLLEVRGEAASDLKKAPSASTLRKWRKAVPPTFEFAVTAGPNLSKVKASDAAFAQRSDIVPNSGYSQVGNRSSWGTCAD